MQRKYHRKIIGKATWGEIIITEYQSYTVAAYLMRKPEISVSTMVNTSITETHGAHGLKQLQKQSSEPIRDGSRYSRSTYFD